jgi:hypothetical protein
MNLAPSSQSFSSIKFCRVQFSQSPPKGIFRELDALYQGPEFLDSCYSDGGKGGESKIARLWDIDPNEHNDGNGTCVLDVAI